MKKKGKAQGKSKDYNDRLCRNRRLAASIKRPKRRKTQEAEEDVEVLEPSSPIMTTKQNQDQLRDSGFINRRLRTKIDGTPSSLDHDGFLLEGELEALGMFFSLNKS